MGAARQIATNQRVERQPIKRRGIFPLDLPAGLVAQLEERRLCKAEALGSNPNKSTKKQTQCAKADTMRERCGVRKHSKRKRANVEMLGPAGVLHFVAETLNRKGHLYGARGRGTRLRSSQHSWTVSPACKRVIFINFMVISAPPLE